MLDFHTPKYEGPLDLLLALIQKNEVSIYDIPISTITDQFLDYLHSNESVSLGDLSEFYKMAADLIWIKSQMLLPKEVEFGEEYEDPREELVQRLIEYSKFKKYSELLIANERVDDYIPMRKEAEFMLPFSDSELLEDVTIKELIDSFMQILKKNLIGEKIFNIYDDVSEKEKLTLMNELLETKTSIKFSDLFANNHSPGHIICSFMAVLEGVKDKVITVSQPKLFYDMVIEKRPVDYNPNKADDYDSEYDEITENNLAEEENYSVIENGD